MVRSAKEADRLNFDVAWVHDYLCWNKLLDSVHISCGSKKSFLDGVNGDSYTPVFMESITNLAFLAGVTEKIRLGIAVLILPYREVIGTAKQIACIDVLSNGRVDLGIGQGAAKTTMNTENEVMSISRATKIRHTREVFEGMREVWTTAESTYHGRFVNFTGAEVFPKPVQKPYPPIWIGGSGEKSLEMIADYADAWLSWGVSPENFPPAIADISERLVERGRDPDSFVAGTEIQIYLANTMEKARAEVLPTMRAFEEGYAGVTGTKYAADPDVLQTMWKSSLIGTPESVTEEIANYLEKGCTAFELKFIYDDINHMSDQWNMFAEKVMPNFR
jgi:alkanesulfonate monooxygenase SsuD/methylene tetrahydromethanopterin reductase-like flavin-dependent oxidoreductase (luciferase family)